MSKIRFRTATIAATTLLLLAGGATAWGAIDTPWSQSDADASHSRANATETTLSTTNIGTVAYRRSLVSPPSVGIDNGCGSGIATPAALVGGHLYAVVSDHLKAYDLATGTQLWDHLLDSTATTFYRSISVAGSRIVISELDCISQSDPNGGLAAFSTSTGAQLWSTPSGVAPGEGSIGQVVISGAYVVTASAGSADSDPFVSVRNLATGTPVWDRTTCYTPVRATALVVGGNVIYTSCNLEDGTGQSLVGATLATGALSWSRAVPWIPEAGDSDATGTTHHLFVQTGTALSDLNPATGATRYSVPGATLRAVAVGGSRFYASCPAGLCAYNRATGAFVWSHATAAPIAVANGMIFTSDGFALQATNGAVLASLWNGTAQNLSVGDGYVAAQTDPRIIDLYGLPGS